jgi:hypothetical protein
MVLLLNQPSRTTLAIENAAIGLRASVATTYLHRPVFQMGDKLPLGPEVDISRKIERPQNSDRQLRRFLDELGYWPRRPGKHWTVSKGVK